MAVHFVGSALMIVVAKAIFFLSAAIVDHMEKMMVGKEGDCTEYGTAVNAVELHLYVGD